MRTNANLNSVGLAHERPGVYAVTVKREGYDELQRDQIFVAAGECHPETVEIAAELEAVSAS